jgi:predicted secreted protein
MESPEVWFMDFCSTMNEEEIDQMFLEVTEGEMHFIKCEDFGYQVWRRRKGHLQRFEEKTQEEFEKNNKFWGMPFVKEGKVIE